MSFIRLFFLVLWATVTYGQTTVRIGRIPPEGILIEKGWRWHEGDNRAWADPSFDDSRWDTLPRFASPESVPALREKGIGWLRTVFVLDSATTVQALSVRFWQMGAAEIYLDGKLFRRLGRIREAVTKASDWVNDAYSPPMGEYYLLPELAAGRHTLAVRLAPYLPKWYEPKRVSLNSTLFACRLIPTEGLASRTADRVFWRAIQNYLLMGFFLALTIIHALYYWYRRQRINAVFSLTTLLFAINNGLGDISNRSTSPPAMEWYNFGGQVTQLMFFTFLLMTYYLYLKRQPPLLFWIVTGIMVLNSVIVFYTDYGYVGYGISIGLAVILGLAIHLSINELKAKSVNAPVVLFSVLILVGILLIESVVNLFVSESFRLQYQYLSQSLDILFFVSIPLTLTVMLARENDQTNRQLAQQLREVERLSTEKEHLLLEQNALLEQQVAERTAELSQSLEELKATQGQLVLREKMASLGELTAGIAHEIQNPLNFVNNFSEVSAELVEELKEERNREDRDEGLEAELLDDLGQNLEKINHHGKRAASIVRGMLEHSRTSTGLREPTDLNALADEYLRLSYHGLRAKTNQGPTGGFNAKLVTEFDPDLPPVRVVAQDIGRVLLNLFNNAFYAVQQQTMQGLPDYQPTVTVTTSRQGSSVVICVTDNGTGIPEPVKQKIFQPFFTTKPTGEGTGLGLSLSYDIITKGHGGTLTVESEVGKGTTFVITLPA